MGIFTNIYRLIKMLRLKRHEKEWIDCDIGLNVNIANNCDIMNCLIYDYANFAHDSQALNSVIGKRTSVGRYSKIRDAEIGSYCSISWDVTIGAPSHPMTHLSSHAFPYRSQFGIIGRDEFIQQKKRLWEMTFG